MTDFDRQFIRALEEAISNGIKNFGASSVLYLIKLLKSLDTERQGGVR